MGEQALWAAVIERAILDLLEPFPMVIWKTRENLRDWRWHREDAAAFLLAGNQDWREHRRWVFNAAGVEFPPEVFDALEAKYKQIGAAFKTWEAAQKARAPEQELACGRI